MAKRVDPEKAPHLAVLSEVLVELKTRAGWGSDKATGKAIGGKNAKGHPTPVNYKTVNAWIKQRGKTPALANQRALLTWVAALLGPAAHERLDFAFMRLNEINGTTDRLARKAAAADTAVKAKPTPQWESDLLAAIKLRQGLMPTTASYFGADMGEIDLDHFWFASPVVDGKIPSYVTRTKVDAHLDRVLRDWVRNPESTPPIVIVVGEPAAGKTRTVIEALRRAGSKVAGKALHQPVNRTATNDSLTKYVQALEAAVTATEKRTKHKYATKDEVWRPGDLISDNGDRGERMAWRSEVDAVCLIDDLHQHFYNPENPEESRGAAVQHLLSEIQRLRVPVIATCHPSVIDAEDPEKFGLTVDDQVWLSQHKVVLNRALDARELRNAQASLARDGVPSAEQDEEVIREWGLYLADAPGLLRQIKRARDAARRGEAAGVARMAVFEALCQESMCTPDVEVAEVSVVRSSAHEWAASDLGMRAPALLDEAFDWLTRARFRGARPLARFDRGWLEFNEAIVDDVLLGYALAPHERAGDEQRVDAASYLLHHGKVPEAVVALEALGDRDCATACILRAHVAGLEEDLPGVGPLEAYWLGRAADLGVESAALALGRHLLAVGEFGRAHEAAQKVVRVSSSPTMLRDAHRLLAAVYGNPLAGGLGSAELADQARRAADLLDGIVNMTFKLDFAGLPIEGSTDDGLESYARSLEKQVAEQERLHGQNWHVDLAFATYQGFRDGD